MDKLQNIYDHPDFYEGYRSLRENPVNYNVLLEHPALLSLLPDPTGKDVLDLGCGFGEICALCAQRGAHSVTGIDLSQRMLAAAERENGGRGIRFKQMDMSQIGELGQHFDLILSSLAVHYVEDFAALAKSVADCLRPDGVFLFSQEHPIGTCHIDETAPYWVYGEDGRALYHPLNGYGRPGKREITWFVDGVVKYHRTFSQLVNALTDAGLTIERMEEPLPSPELVAQYPFFEKEYHKPSFLLILARKK